MRLAAPASRTEQGDTYEDSLLVDNLGYRGARIHDHKETNNGTG